MRWAKQLELAASEVEEPDVPEAEGEVIFAEKYQSEHAYSEMNDALQALEQRVGKGATVVRPPIPAMTPNGTRIANTLQPEDTVGSSTGVPSGAEALRTWVPSMSAGAAELPAVFLTSEEVLLICHTSKSAESAGGQERGTCHSAPTSNRAWLTRTRIADGKVVPLLWSCHKKIPDAADDPTRWCSPCPRPRQHSCKSPV
jgi:hypothetical protein